MAADEYQLSPRLLSIVTHKDLERLPKRLTPSMFPGNYSRIVMRHRRMVRPTHPLVRLACRSCGRQADYPIYPMAVSREFLAHPGSMNLGSLQMMAYIRCKGCNAAEQLDFPNRRMPFLLQAQLIAAGAVPAGADPEKSPVNYGIYEMFDGTRPRSAIDAEAHLLDLIEAGTADVAFLWDRLGNIYERGGRADLAAVAFEQSIQIDARQFESLYSLGLLLTDVGALDDGGYLLRRALACAAGYRRLAGPTQRAVVVDVLTRLAERNMPIWPTADEVSLSGDGIWRGNPPIVNLSADAGLEQVADWILARHPVLQRKIGRNDPCPCGSGKKYKRCCGA